MKLGASILTGIVALAGGVACLHAEPPKSRDASNLREAITLPNKEYEIYLPTMGIIKEVRVKEGDAVKKGDVLLVQDTTEEEAELKILQFDADSVNEIEAAKKEYELKNLKYTSAKRLMDDGGRNEQEVAEKKADAEIAEIKIKQAQQESEQKKLKRDKQLEHVKRMKLTAETDGVVLKILNDLGSNIDMTKPALVMVENNPLKVEVQVPALTSMQLKKGDKLRVSYNKKDWKEAPVSYLSPKADAGSGTRTIHLEMPNPEGDPSGLQVYVELPDKLLASAEGSK